MNSIIELAREAGLYVGTNLSGIQLVVHKSEDGIHGHITIDELTRFAHLVRAQALEEAAKKSEALGVHPALNVYNGGPDWYRHGKEIAAAIRAMKEQV